MKEIVIKAMHGDDRSFYQAISENKEKLYRIAYSYVKNKEDALDIVQDTVYKAFISIKKLKDPEFFNTWLTRILINCAINYLKKSKKIVYVDKYYSNDTSNDLNYREEVMDLYKALDKLEVKYKTVVILKYFEDMTFEDISKILNVPLSTVKTHLYRALKKLKVDLREGTNLE